MANNLTALPKICRTSPYYWLAPGGQRSGPVAHEVAGERWMLRCGQGWQPHAVTRAIEPAALRREGRYRYRPGFLKGMGSLARSATIGGKRRGSQLRKVGPWGGPNRVAENHRLRGVTTGERADFHGGILDGRVSGKCRHDSGCLVSMVGDAKAYAPCARSF